MWINDKWVSRRRPNRQGGHVGILRMFVAPLAGLALMLGASGGLVAVDVVTAPSAEAHTPAVLPECGKLKVNMQSYNTTKDNAGQYKNTITVKIDTDADGDLDIVENAVKFGASFVKEYAVSKTANHAYEVRVVAWDDSDSDGDGNGANGWTKKFTGTVYSCETSAPVSPTVNPTTPDCTNRNVTVTPLQQEGVQWTPAGSTVLAPGQSVTYTAAPSNPNKPFPPGTQTSFPFTNNLNTETCVTSAPVSPTIAPQQPSCAVLNQTVTPGTQPGVIWKPSTPTVLTPGQSVTYTASPSDPNRPFPSGAQTVFPFTNTFNVVPCNPPHDVLAPDGHLTADCTGTITAFGSNTASNVIASYQLVYKTPRKSKNVSFDVVASGTRQVVRHNAKNGSMAYLWGPADVLLDSVKVPRECAKLKSHGNVTCDCTRPGVAKVTINTKGSNRGQQFTITADGGDWARSKKVWVAAGVANKVIIWRNLPKGTIVTLSNSPGVVLDEDVVEGNCVDLPPDGGTRQVAARVSPGKE